MVDTLLNEWSSNDPVAAAAWANRLPDSLKEAAFAMILSVWGSADPAKAAQWAAQFPAGETRERAIPVLAETWAAIDPAAAVRWTLNLPESAEQSDALDQAVRTWSIQEQDALTSWIQQQPAGPEADRLRVTAATILVDKTPREAVEMASAISDPVIRRETMEQLLDEWKNNKPQETEQWLKDHPQAP
jgi:hypothetical protein